MIGIRTEELGLGERFDASVNVDQQIKQMAYNRAIERVRKQLSPSQRLISRIAHLPLVEELSEAAGRTVGRPSGLIGAGGLAFFGSIIYYLMARTGGQYNFSVFIFLLATGFATGILFELLHRLAGKD